MGVRVRWKLQRQPLSFVCTDSVRLDSIVFITELLVVEIQVLLKVFSAGEAAVKYLIRFIQALGDIQWVSVIPSVPGVDAPHILTSASESITAHAHFPSKSMELTARHIRPHPRVLAQGRVITLDRS